MRQLFLVLTGFVLAYSASAQNALTPHIIYQVPEMAKVQIKEKIQFSKVNDTALTMDVYYPPDYNKNKKLPVVIFNNGVGALDIPRWPIYQDWAKLVAANGMIAINHQARPSRTGAPVDCAAVLDYLKQHGRELGIDTDKMGIWTCSANARVGISLALKPGREYVRTLVVYYGGPDSLGQIRQDVPTMVVRAGKDAQFLNMAIENFVQNLLQQDAPMELVNYLDGIHAFDMYINTAESKAIIKRTVDFLKKNLNDPVPILTEPVLTNRNFMWMMNNGQAEKAATAFRKAVTQYRADPDFQPFFNGVIREDILNANAYWLMDHNKKPEALETFKLMVEAYPNSANAHDGLSDAYEALGNKPEALRYAEKVLALLPNDSSVNDQFKARIRASAEEKIRKLKGN